MTIIIRVATNSDLDTLARLNQVVQSVHADLYPDDFAPTVDDEGLKALLSPRVGNIAIAEVNGEPVGYIWCEVQTRPASAFSPAHRRLYVHHLSVEPDARRQGIASALMSHAEAWAHGEELSEIALSHWAANAGAAQFFTAHGFTPYQVLMRKRLGNDEAPE